MSRWPTQDQRRFKPPFPSPPMCGLLCEITQRKAAPPSAVPATDGIPALAPRCPKGWYDWSDPKLLQVLLRHSKLEREERAWMQAAEISHGACILQRDVQRQRDPSSVKNDSSLHIKTWKVHTCIVYNLMEFICMYMY